METDLLTAAEFSSLAGIERRYVTRWAQSGEVQGARKESRAGSINEVWVATKGAWEAAAAQERKVGYPTGRPRKTKPQSL